jgi:hypothetical protein
MTKETDLAGAAVLCKRRTDLKTFRYGLVDQAWGGDVHIGFGGYSAWIHAGDISVGEPLLQAIDNEIENIETRLKAMGVQTGE